MEATALDFRTFWRVLGRSGANASQPGAGVPVGAIAAVLVQLGLVKPLGLC